MPATITSCAVIRKATWWAGYSAQRRPCDALSARPSRQSVCARTLHRRKAQDVIPRQMFEIPIQAAIGGKVIARETVKAMRRRIDEVLRRRHQPSANCWKSRGNRSVLISWAMCRCRAKRS
ncbi:MAG: hypothetical protein ACLS6G_13995 [Christensenellales bacterium]